MNHMFLAMILSLVQKNKVPHHKVHFEMRYGIRRIRALRQLLRCPSESRRDPEGIKSVFQKSHRTPSDQSPFTPGPATHCSLHQTHL